MNINLKNNSEKEQKTKKLLEGLFNRFNLDKWILCDEILIEEGGRGKAFPFIILSAGLNEDILLAQFLHEQSHWVHGNIVGAENMDKAIDELKEIFKSVPIDKPEGGGSEKSTYIHLIICRLEFLALKELLGEEKAMNIVSNNNNYTWIRKTILDSSPIIDQIIERYFPRIY
ncbi:MAG TPA: hypothetical protein VI432_01425 [Candidatus Paceibacterota bacterium]